MEEAGSVEITSTTHDQVFDAVAYADATARAYAVPDASSTSTATAVVADLAAKQKRHRKSTGKQFRWTSAEEERLRLLVEELGASGKVWEEIAARLGSGRTPSGLQQHWQIMCGKRGSGAPSTLSLKEFAVTVLPPDRSGELDGAPLVVAERAPKRPRPRAAATAAVVAVVADGGGLAAANDAWVQGCGARDLIASGTWAPRFAELRALGHGAAPIAGAYRRSLLTRPATLSADTTTRAVTIQTPTVFCDVRIGAARPADARGLDAPTTTLGALASESHAFAGFASLTHAANPHAVCTRIHAIDWHPPPRRSPNRWRVDERWESGGGFVEWGLPNDEMGQASYVEHWKTLQASRDGPFVALQRHRGVATGASAGAAFFVLAGDHWAFISDRPPPQSLHAAAPPPAADGEDAVGSAAAVARAAVDGGDRRTLHNILSLEASYGTRSADVPCAEGAVLRGGARDAPPAPWIIALSTLPWREGESIAPWLASLAVADAAGGAVPAVVTEATAGGATVEWEVVERTGVDSAEALRRILAAVPAGTQAVEDVD